MYTDNHECRYIQTLEDGTVWEQGFIKEKKINILSPQGLDVKFYQACRSVIMVCQLHLTKSVKRLLQLKQHNRSVTCPSLLLIHQCHFHLIRGKLWGNVSEIPNTVTFFVHTGF